MISAIYTLKNMISMTMDGHWYLHISLYFVLELSPQCPVLLVISQCHKNGYFLIFFLFFFFHIFVFTFYNAPLLHTSRLGAWHREANGAFFSCRGDRGHDL